MNNKRRKRISDAMLKIDIATEILESVLDEEDEARDNMPESLEGSERYMQSEECSDVLKEALDSLDSARESLTSANEALSTIV